MIITKSEIPLSPAFPFQIEHRTLTTADNCPDHFHWHSCFEITYILHGQGQYFVNGQIYTVSDGDIILFNNIEPHGWEVRDSLELIVMVFQPELIANGFALLDYDYLEPFLKRGTNFKNVLPASEQVTRDIYKLLKEISDEEDRHTVGYQLMIKANILKILTLLIRHSQDSSKSDRLLSRKALEMKRLSNVFEYINQNYAEHLTLADAAEMAYMSPNYFSQYFKKVTGQNFSDYLNGLRIKKAQDMLHDTNSSVIDVAMACGFRNMSNFYRMYKKYTGTTPSARTDK